MDPVNAPAKLEVRSFTHFWDNSNRSFGWGCEPQSWGRGGLRGSEMVPFERALASSYRPSIVTFPLSLRVSEILPLLCSSTPLFPTQPLVSSKFPNLPLGVGGWPLGYEERMRWANCPCNPAGIKWSRNQLLHGRDGSRICQGGGTMASMAHEPIMGGPKVEPNNSPPCPRQTASRSHDQPQLLVRDGHSCLDSGMTKYHVDRIGHIIIASTVGLALITAPWILKQPN